MGLLGVPLRRRVAIAASGPILTGTVRTGVFIRRGLVRHRTGIDTRGHIILRVLPVPGLRPGIGAIVTVLLVLLVLLALLLRFAFLDIHNPKIMFGVLIHIFSRYTIPGRVRVSRQLYVLFIHLMRITANADTGTVAIEALMPWGPITTSPAAAARPLRTLTLSHITVT